jgi:prophage regulatory protein
MKQRGGTPVTINTSVGELGAPPDKILRLAELRALVPYSSMHLWRLERAGRFPARIHLGPNRVGWSLAEVTAWINERKAERHQAQP